MYGFRRPDNLVQFDEIVMAAGENDRDHFIESYVYLTAKTLWVSGDYIGNRPGWHSDGYRTTDVNYIWCDRAPTDFLHAPAGLKLDEDCDTSLQQMNGYGLRPGMYGAEIVQFPDKHLLRLDETVIHRSPASFAPGMRTFVKVSISESRYNLIGNSVNHQLPIPGEMFPRGETRNHPTRDFE
jgi:hypothetical protein